MLRAISDRRKAVAECADEATVKKLSDAVTEAGRNARAAGYAPSVIARIISTPSDMSMFSRLPEADQRAILRQASDAEFESYIPPALVQRSAARIGIDDANRSLIGSRFPVDMNCLR